jgi:hypothetical protein
MKKIKEVEMGRACSMHGRDKCTQYRHKWEYNITIDLKELGWKNVDWMHLVEPGGQWWALVNTVINPEAS